jgi:Domain of unknown function (DUF4247)
VSGVAGRVIAFVVVLLVLVACGGGDELRDYVANTYDVVSADGDNLEARSAESVDTVASDLTGRFEPRDRYDEEAGTFFRHDDDFVAVRPDPTGGTLISVDSDETGSTRWVPFIGPIFLPGGRFGGPRIPSGRARNGGTGETNRGGGPGAGK